MADFFQNTLQNVQDVFLRVESLTKFAKITTHTDEIERLQVLLSLRPTNFSEDAKLPCIILPVAKNAHFYDRGGVINSIQAHLDNPSEQGFHSLALYGLGGVGKSHVALRYAHSRTDELDAILWIHSETATAISQSFSEIAVRLKLPSAEPRKHSENRILVLNWLQHTST